MSFDTADAWAGSYIAAIEQKHCSNLIANHQMLYLSQLVPNVRYDVFSAICRVSRRRNAELSLSGVLLFDGHRFCQLLDGPPASVALVRQSIEKDPRHEFMTVLADRPGDAATAPEPWQAGYCEADDLDQLVGPERLDEEQALAVFRAIVKRADLSP